MFTGTIQHFNNVSRYGLCEYNNKQAFVHVTNCISGNPSYGDFIAFNTGDNISFNIKDNIAIQVEYISPPAYASSSDEEDATQSPKRTIQVNTPKTKRTAPNKKVKPPNKNGKRQSSLPPKIELV